MPRQPNLTVTGTTPITTPPPDRGRLMTAEQVAADLLHGTVSESWVRRNVEAGRVRLGHSTVRWFENDVRVWLESQREGAA